MTTQSIQLIQKMASTQQKTSLDQQKKQQKISNVIQCNLPIRKTAFISGHTDLSYDNFIKYYSPLIDKAILEDHLFIIGDANGVDAFAQQYLKDKIDNNRIKIYHIGTIPRNYLCGGVLVGEFKNDSKRDSQLTRDSDYDILYYRSEQDCRDFYGDTYFYRVSGTQKNQERRQLSKYKK